MQQDENETANFDEPVPVLNPNWQEALDKVMHTSLMSKNAQALDTKEGNEDDGDEGLSDIEENLEVDTQPADEDEDDDEPVHSRYEKDDAFSSDEDEDDSSVKANHGGARSRSYSPIDSPKSRSPSPDRSRSRSASESESPSPAPRSRRKASTKARDPSPVPTPVIHVRRDPKVEATKKRIQENLTLQKEEKYELLGRLQYVIDEKGFKPFRMLGPDDTLEDIRYEVFRANREMAKKRNVKMMQKALVTVGAGVEMMNSWYNPLNLRLDGFSKSLLLGIREYDEVLEELHWKYCDAVAMPPEMKLAMTFGSSLWFFHISNHSTTPSATNAPPQPPPPSAASEAPQRRMNGPRASSSSPFGMDGGGSGPAPLDMTTLMSGIGMVQSLMNTGAKF